MSDSTSLDTFLRRFALEQAVTLAAATNTSERRVGYNEVDVVRVANRFFDFIKKGNQ